jgi:hypothetical protein
MLYAGTGAAVGREKAQMADDSLDIPMLLKRIEKQEQFTRMVSLICCIAILSVMFYTVTEMFSDLPQLIVVHAMSNMKTIVTERHLVDSVAAKRSGEVKSSSEVKPGTRKTGETTSAASGKSL